MEQRFGNKDVERKENKKNILVGGSKAKLHAQCGFMNQPRANRVPLPKQQRKDDAY